MCQTDIWNVINLSVLFITFGGRARKLKNLGIKYGMYFDSENSQIKCTTGTKTFKFDAQIDEKNLWNFVFKIITVTRFLYVQRWKGHQKPYLDYLLETEKKIKLWI